MNYIYVVVDSGFELIAAFDTERAASEFVYELQLEWPITERPEYYIEQVEYYK